MNNAVTRITSHIIHVNKHEIKFFERFINRNNIKFNNNAWNPDDKKQQILRLNKSMVGIINTPIRKIYIEPKFNISLNYVWRMYFYVHGFNNRLDNHILNVDKFNGFNNIINNFLNELTKQIQKGLPKRYVHTSERTNFWKGNVKLKPSLLNIKMYKNRPIVSNMFYLSLDTPLNRLLKAALLKIYNNKRYNLRTFHLLKYFKNTNYQNNSGLYMYNQIRFDKSNIKFRNLAIKAKMILDNIFITDNLGNIGGNSFLINLDILFEKFTRKILSSIPNEPFTPNKSNSKKLIGTIYSNNNSPYTGPDNSRHFIPDIMYKNDSSTFDVLDAKDKGANERFNPADIYQVLTYATILRSKKIILLYPSLRPKEPLKFVISHPNLHRIIHAVFIDIKTPSSSEFIKSIKIFRNEVMNILHG